MNPHEKALDGMFDDMDDFESKKMFGKPDEEKGVSITISVSPNGDVGEPEMMNKGGEVCMSEGGTVPKPELEADTFTGYDKEDPEYKKGEVGMSEGGMVEEDMDLPPFLRKKKIK